jgi:hypothetical protein
MFFTKRPKNLLKNSNGAHRMGSNFTMAEESDPMSRSKMWKAPEGIIKVNWEASVNINAGYVGVGIIARDSGGKFFGSWKCD